MTDINILTGGLGVEDAKTLIDTAQNNVSTPSTLAVRPHDPDRTNSIVAKTSIADAAMEGKPIKVENLVDKFIKYKEMAGSDPNFEGVKDLIISLRKQKDYTAISNLVGNYVNEMRPEELNKLLMDRPGLYDEIERSSTGATAFPRAFVESVTDAPTSTFEQDIQESMIAKQANAEVIGKMFEDEGWWDKISNVVGQMFIPDYNKDIADAMQSGLIDAPTFMQNFIQHWSTLSPEDQVTLFPQLRDYLLPYMEGNKRKVAGVLQELLAPGGGEEIRGRAIAEAVFAGLDVAGFAKGLTGLYKSMNNSVKVMKELRRVDEAAHLNASAIQDNSGNIARAVGTDKSAAITNGMPFPAEHLDSTRYADNISGKVMEQIRKEEARMTAMMADDSVLRGEALRPNEIENIKNTYLAKYRTDENELISGLHSANFTQETTRGMNFELVFGQSKTGAPFTSKKSAQARLRKLQDENIIPDGEIVPVENGFAIKRTENIRFTQDDVGEYLGTPQAGPVAVRLWSPSSWFVHLEAAPGEAKRTSDAVNAASRADLGKQVWIDSMNRMVNAATSPLGNVTFNPAARRRLNRVNQALLQGDAHTELLPDGQVSRGKVYTPAELKQGITLPDGSTLHLTEKEQQAYYGLRRVADWMFAVKNQNTRNVLEFKGFKTIDVEGKPALGKPYESAQAARSSLAGRNVDSLYDPTANNGLGGVSKRVNIDFEDMYSKGYRLAHLQQPAKIGADSYNYVWSKVDGISDLPATVLHYKTGYVPKIYTDGLYFVKESMLGTVDGVPNRQVGSKTHRMFDTAKEAELFAARQNKARVLAQAMLNSGDDVLVHKIRTEILELGVDETELRELLEAITKGEVSVRPDAFQVVRDREMSAVQLMNESAGASGGLFTAPRATHDILFGLNGEVPRRVSASEAIQRYTQHLSNYVPRNEWRIAEQQRWLNKAHSMGIIDPEVHDFKTAAVSIKATPGSPESSTMTAAARWIEDQARIPTVEEKAFSQVMINMAEYLEKPIGPFSAAAPKAVRNLLHASAKHDVFAEARTLAFHTLLGWYNPAQLFVQAQGATVAMSLHPESWRFAMQRGMGLVATMFSENPAYIAATGKKLGLKSDEFVAMHDLFKRSGLRDSVLATADYSAAAQGYGFGMSAVKRAADNGLVFYRAGELWNRSYSFSTAVDQWMKRNPNRLLKTVSNKELREIVNETLNISLNMTSANRASWQKGMLGIPTQFMQIQAKWLEAIFPSVTGPAGASKFTLNERTKGLLMQAAIYGAAGLPAGGFVAGEAAKLLGYNNAEEIPPEVIKYINGGIWDLSFYSAIGADVETGGRGAIVSGLVESMVDAVTNQHDLSSYLGAFGQSASSILKGFSTLAPMMFNADKLEWTGEEAQYVADTMAKSVATWRNASKAYMMYKTNTIVDKHGNPMINKTMEGGFNGATLIGQALGFQVSEQKHLFALKDLNKAADSYKADLVDKLIELHINYLKNTDDPIVMKNTKAMTDYYLRMLDPDERQTVMNNVAKKLMESKDQRTKQLLHLYQNHSSKVLEEVHTNALKTGIAPAFNELTNMTMQKNVRGNQ